MKKKLIIVALLFSIWNYSEAQHINQASQKNDKRFDWFHEAKFGMFIHWGPYAILGGEYNGQKVKSSEWVQLRAGIPADEYEKICRNFNPVNFNAESWVKLAKDAGMKYIVFTAKHHDGFCMFKTKETDYNIVDYTPFKRDVLKELSDACKKYGIKLGTYYSIADWHHPEFEAKYSNQKTNFHGRPNPEADISKYADYQIAQVKELMSNYGPVAVAWFDGGGSFEGYDRFSLLKGDEMIAAIRKLQPECLINNRIGEGKGDYGTPEQTIPGTIQKQAFEVCMTMNRHWGYYNGDNEWKSKEELILKLIDIAHKGGNFLLNVGPDMNGEIPLPSVERLKYMGEWLKINGESIYGTQNSLWNEPAWGKSTTRIMKNGDTRIYLFVTNWPDDGKIRVPGIGRKARRSFILGKEEIPVSITREENGLTLLVPQKRPKSVIPVVVLDIKGKVNTKAEGKDNDVINNAY